MIRFAQNFGMLVINLKSIEFLARAMLTNKFGAIKFPKRVDTYRVGEKIIRCYLTDVIYLRNILDKFVSEFDFELDIDRICLLRNAIAHGRLSAFSKGGPLHMFNTKALPSDDMHVEIEWNAVLDESWFKRENAYAKEVLDRMNALNESQ